MQGHACAPNRLTALYKPVLRFCLQIPKEFNLRYNGYVEKYETLNERYNSLAAEQKRKAEKAKAIDGFIHSVESRDDLLTEFNPNLWPITVEKVTITDDGKMLSTSLAGRKYPAE